MGDLDGPALARGEAPPSIVKTARGAVKLEIEALEKAGFKVDHEVYNAPVVQDGKRLYGISRQALESEGAFGDRWTNIITAPEKWPKKPIIGKSLRGKLAAAWRKTGLALFETIKGPHLVDKTGEIIHVGRRGLKHSLGQGQTPEAIQAISSLPEIIKKAFKIAEYNPHPMGEVLDLRRRVIYQSAVVIDGESYSIRLLSSRKPDGHLELDFYDLRAGKKKRSPQSPDLPRESVEPPSSLDHADFPTDNQLTKATKAPNGPTDSLPASDKVSLSEEKVADFFRDVKDVID